MTEPVVDIDQLLKQAAELQGRKVDDEKDEESAEPTEFLVFTQYVEEVRFELARKGLLFVTDERDRRYEARLVPDEDEEPCHSGSIVWVVPLDEDEYLPIGAGEESFTIHFTLNIQDYACGRIFGKFYPEAVDGPTVGSLGQEKIHAAAAEILATHEPNTPHVVVYRWVYLDDDRKIVEVVDDRDKVVPWSIYKADGNTVFTHVVFADVPQFSEAIFRIIWDDGGEEEMNRRGLDSGNFVLLSIDYRITTASDVESQLVLKDLDERRADSPSS